MQAAGEEAREELEARGIYRGLGYCHHLWETQQRILQEKHGIAWRTPAQMNGIVIID